MPAFCKNRPLHFSIIDHSDSLFGLPLKFIGFFLFNMFIEHIPDPGCCSGYWEQKIRQGEADLQESLSQVHPEIGPAGTGHPTASFTLRWKYILGTERTSQNFSFQNSKVKSWIVLGYPMGQREKWRPLHPEAQQHMCIVYGCGRWKFRIKVLADCVPGEGSCSVLPMATSLSAIWYLLLFLERHWFLRRTFTLMTSHNPPH